MLKKNKVSLFASGLSLWNRCINLAVFAMVFFGSLSFTILGEENQNIIPDGDYRIYCHTRNGLRFLEAFPTDDVVRAREERDEKCKWSEDQKWSIKHIGDGCYKISCDTVNKGLRFLEAFPTDDVVRARLRGRDEQRWLQDQKWLITRSLRNDYFKISCNTVNKGLRFLEAFNNIIRPRAEVVYEQDQEWGFLPFGVFPPPPPRPDADNNQGQNPQQGANGGDLNQNPPPTLPQNLSEDIKRYNQNELKHIVNPKKPKKYYPFPIPNNRKRIEYSSDSDDENNWSE